MAPRYGQSSELDYTIYSMGFCATQLAFWLKLEIIWLANIQVVRPLITGTNEHYQGITFKVG
ncbi:hypothetical protein ACSS6W_002356 [Trichoderma asperelloides]